VPIELSDSSAASTHLLAQEEELLIRLKENPTTGYRWEVTQSGSGELELVDDRFVASVGDAIPGAGGERVVRFVGRKPGSVQIEAVARRSWESSNSSQERRVYSIVIK
jgi:inhibitor of cysteine peptidase